MRIIIALALAFTLGAQVAEPTKPPQFSHEQKDALKDAMIASLSSKDQVTAAQKNADEANAAFIKLLNETLVKVGACKGAQVDMSFTIICPK